MPRVKMPTGEIVDMPDNPTPQQLEALSQIHASAGTSSPAEGSNPGLPGEGSQAPVQTAAAAPVAPVAPKPQPAPHTPWGPEGSTLRAIQNFLATPQEGFQSPVANQLAHGTGLAAGMLGKGITGTAGLVADAAAGLAGQRDNLPSQRFANLFPQPQGAGEKVADFAGTMATGMGADPLAKLATAGMSAARPGPRPATVPELNLQEGRQAGYVAPPSLSRASVPGRIVEGFAGKQAVADTMTSKNQNVTNMLARKAAGLADDAPLDNATLSDAMSKTYKEGYEPIKAAGRMTTGGVYRKALDKVVKDFGGQNPDFPAADNKAVRDLVDAHRVTQFDAGNAVAAIRSLRDGANDAYKAGNSALMKANRGIADAIENNIDLNLASRGDREMLANYRSARQQLAKQGTVQRALQEGTGNIDARKIASAMKRGKPLTDELQTIGRFAGSYGGVAGIPTHGASTPTPNVLNSALAGLVAGPGAGFAVAAKPFAAMGVQRALASSAGQRLFSDPNLAPSLMQRGIDPRLLRGLPSMATGLYGGE